MRTPCQDAPEAWVGEDIKLRAEAARICLTCPALDWCKAEAARIKPEHGVMAGRDYSRNSATDDPTVCARPGCDEEFQLATVGPKRRYCSERCRYLTAGTQPINHGTEGGAKTHQRRGEKPCGLCREALLRIRRDRESKREETAA